jgi:hypothetical protein
MLKASPGCANVQGTQGGGRGGGRKSSRPPAAKGGVGSPSPAVLEDFVAGAARHGVELLCPGLLGEGTVRLLLGAPALAGRPARRASRPPLAWRARKLQAQRPRAVLLRAVPASGVVPAEGWHRSWLRRIGV